MERSGNRQWTLRGIATSAFRRHSRSCAFIVEIGSGPFGGLRRHGLEFLGKGGGVGGWKSAVDPSGDCDISVGPFHLADDEVWKPAVDPSGELVQGQLGSHTIISWWL